MCALRHRQTDQPCGAHPTTTRCVCWGASAFGAQNIIMSDTARAMVVERGQEDWYSEFQRFPRLFEGHESIPGLTWPTTTFSDSMTVYLGNRRIDIKHLGRAHTAGDAVIHVPDQNVMFTRRHRRIPLRLLLRRRAFWRLGQHARQYQSL